MKAAVVSLSLFSCRTVLAESSSLRGGRQEIEARIVGGHDAQEGAYPFMVQWAGCGASLIHPQFLLTAAHVSFYFPPEVLASSSYTYVITNSH